MLVKTKTCALSQILEKSWNIITLTKKQPHLPKKLRAIDRRCYSH